MLHLKGKKKVRDVMTHSSLAPQGINPRLLWSTIPEDEPTWRCQSKMKVNNMPWHKKRSRFHGYTLIPGSSRACDSGDIQESARGQDQMRAPERARG